jgi:serine/threonine protein kinase
MHERYTILRSLGKGGMGALYLASETIANQERLVVIKEMLDYYDPDDPQGETKALKRFESEAATLTRLNTVGIPLIFEFFSAAGRNYIVMQYIQGENLESGLTHQDENGAWIQGKPYAVDRVRRWGIQLCKVLETLSAQSVVHMDIKPANLIVNEIGDIWLVDFGTAKAPHGSNPGGAVGLEKSSVYGTQGYAPPEQAAGNAEVRSDVYALAATLYHLLTDDDPRDSPFSFPQLDTLPSDIQAALKMALAFDVNQRCSARQFAALLEAGTEPAAASTFRWQNGTLSSQPRDLAATSNKNWEEARGYFIGDEWARWFKEMHRHDLVAQLQQAKSQYKDPDLALDAFLRLIDPSLDPPAIHLPVPVLDGGVVPWQKQTVLELEIFNLGGGALQGRFIDLPAGIQVSPVQFVTHEWQKARITLDTSELSPSSKQQTLFVGIDAGNAGKKYVPITVTIPEPKMRLDHSTLDLGITGRNESALTSLRVSNAGGSPFLAEVSGQASWLRVEPARFLCSPGKPYLLKVSAHPRHLKPGENSSRINLTARANNWSQSLQVPVRVVLRQGKPEREPIRMENSRPLNTAPVPADWTLPTGGAIILAVYGLFFGGFLGYLAAGIFGGVSNVFGGMLAGAMIGMFLSLLPGAITGAAGRLNRQPGRPGLRAGLRSGVAVGMLSGALAGGASELLLTAIGMNLAAGQGMNILGAVVGVVVGLTLAALLGWRGG